MATYWENSCSFGLRYVSWYKYLIVSLVFSHLGFWSGNLFLIAPFPDLCLLVPFFSLALVLIPFCQLSFSNLGFWNGNFFLIVPFPDHCLLLPFYSQTKRNRTDMLHCFFQTPTCSSTASDFSLKV